MKTFTFKTNIKCGGCIATVTPALNGTQGIEKWEVDISTPEKILTVQASATETQIMDAVKKAGFQINRLN